MYEIFSSSSDEHYIVSSLGQIRYDKLNEYTFPENVSLEYLQNFEESNKSLIEELSVELYTPQQAEKLLSLLSFKNSERCVRVAGVFNGIFYEGYAYVF